MVVDDQKRFWKKPMLCVPLPIHHPKLTTILEHNWIPSKLGLTREGNEDHAYLQCVDPGEPYTDGGTVIFRCRKIDK
jgi:hypothetical protein